jgi:hypothetical protein
VTAVIVLACLFGPGILLAALFHRIRTLGKRYDKLTARWVDAEAPRWRDDWADLADATQETVFCGCTYWDSRGDRYQRERCPKHRAEVVATILACGCAVTRLDGGDSQVARCPGHVVNADLQAWESELSR